MSKTLRVLSVDFDFFQNVSKEVIYRYPDGHDLPTDLSVMIWSSHYANDDGSLASVDIMQDKFKEFKEILKHNAINQPDILITNSHVHIYKFIMNKFFDDDYDKLRLTNVDMHHDMFNSNEELDCGNWIIKLCDNLENVGLTWIANPISRSVYGLDSKFDNIIETTFDSIKNKHFDLIFLCRSDIWSPPHLDKYFNELVELITDNFLGVKIDTQVSKPREYEEEVAQIKSVYNQLKNCKGDK